MVKSPLDAESDWMRRFLSRWAIRPFPSIFTAGKSSHDVFSHLFAIIAAENVLGDLG